jgi:hypothetical protein
MEPQIVKTRFGQITLQEGGEKRAYEHDILIRLDGSVCKRKKKLSKQVYGTSHTLSLAEAEHVYEPGAEKLVIATGVFDRVRLSDGAAAYFQRRGVEVQLLKTSKAVKKWNELSGPVIGLFHVSC